ncbi:MAG: tyrosine--tRNA ligase [Patescibacteria group bacterium]|nr:tyrosine--tRNA ligase [Patescibacteria group bacterium]
MDLFNELKERGLVFQTSKEEAVKEYLSMKGGKFYIGFDPTAESLHVGSLLPIVFIKRLEQAGLKPIVLVGGATGLIGDPSGRSQERNLLDLKTVGKNVCALKKQLSRFFDFGHFCCDGKVLFVDNYDWIKKISFIEVLRDFGKHFTLNEMISKESVQKRMVTGISFTEFTYMILQSIDFLNLYQKYNCKMQVGGSDQWGNMTAGIELIRKKIGKEGLVLSMPLVTKSDGTKFGKSEGGAVWLDAKLTSPYQFYQFWVNVEDTKAIEYLKYYTFLSLDEIKRLEEAVAKEPQKREAQKTLAAEMTRFVHGDVAVAHAEDISQKLFYGKIKELSREDVEEIFSGTKKDIKAAASWPIADFLVEAGVVGSKRQAREDVENKAIEMNGEKISSLDSVVKKEDSLFGAGFFVVKRGKKDYHFVKIL